MQYYLILIISFLLPLNVGAEQPSTPSETELKKNVQQLQKPLYTPFLERYMLDELKYLRQDQQKLREDTTKQITHMQLDAADRAITYTTDTINNVLFIITATATILVVVGWTSFRDIKSKVEVLVNERVGNITDEYEQRLQILEVKLKERTEEILTNHKKITITNEVHSLWMRANLESDMNSKVEIYDEILKRKPDEIEAIAYKADALLELGQTDLALNLCNQALDMEDDYGYAYWQRACAYAMLEKQDDAIADIKKALEYSPTLKNELVNEVAFANLKANEGFQRLTDS